MKIKYKLLTLVIFTYLAGLVLVWGVLAEVDKYILCGEVFFFTLLGLFIVSLKIHYLLSSPLMNLAKLANKISNEKDYSTRAVKQSNDEVGELIDAFNEMLEQIHQRDTELLDAKQSLELKVKQRTAEITSTNEILVKEIAERVNAEEKLEESLAKLEETNEAMKNFVYIASHDLREPLRKITSFGHILENSLKEKISNDDMENLRFMVEGADRMDKMIKGLLVYSRVSSNSQPPEDVDLNEIITQLQQLELSVALTEKQAVIEVAGTLPTIEADPVQIRELLQNLIANGIKYQPKGRRPLIKICSKPAENGMVRIEVKDNGIGIGAEYLSAIFVMFKRLHTRNEYEGTGIGLSICKKIVELQGGKIGVESQPDAGSTFWFTVPASAKKAKAVSI